MKKWIPYLVALLIPIMIFVSFLWMIKKRTFIFKEAFIQKGLELVDNIQLSYKDSLIKDVFLKLPQLEGKLTNPDDAQIKTLLKNLILDSTMVENIFITDTDSNLKYFYNSVEKEKLKDLDWMVKNLPESESVQFLFYKSVYIAFKKYQNQNLFIFLNPSIFFRQMKEKYPFLNREIIFNQKNMFFNFIQKDYSDHTDTIQKAMAIMDSGKKVILELEGNYLFAKKLILEKEGKPLYEMNLFLYLPPSKMPLTVFQKIILIFTALVIIIMLFILLLKIKNDSYASKIRTYEAGNEFWNKNFSEGDENEEYEEEEEPSDESLEIPQKYYESPTKEKKDQELTTLIGEVNTHEETIQKYNSLWKNTSEILSNKTDYNMGIFLLDSDSNELTSHFVKNLFSEILPTFTMDQWVIKTYIERNLSLYVREHAMAATPVKEILNSDEYQMIESFFIAPLMQERKLKGIFYIASSGFIDEKTIQEINSLIQLG